MSEPSKTVSTVEGGTVLVTPPGAGGWTPPAWMPVLIGIGGAGATAVADLISASCVSGVCVQVTVAMVVGAFVKGIVMGAVGFFGTKSAGPRTPSA